MVPRKRNLLEAFQSARHEPETELPPAIGAERYVSFVAAIPPDGSGVPEREDAAFRQVHAAFIRQIPGHLSWLEAGALRPPVRTYLALSIDCKYRPQSESKVPAGLPPLLAYRHAVCDSLVRPSLEELRANNPAFVEAAYFINLAFMALFVFVLGK